MLLGSVQVCGEKLSHVEVKDICRSLDAHKIRLLSLRDCTIRDKDYNRLLKSVTHCKSIFQLNLNVNVVSSVPRVHLLKSALFRNRSLTHLFLHGNPLGDKGVAILTGGLSLHPNIVSLDLGDCGLTDSAIPFVAALLPTYGAKKGLLELTLSANPGVTARGWTCLLVAMAAAGRLRTLNLDYNHIGDYGVGCLASLLAASKTMETLDLEGAEVTEFGGQTLLDLVKNFPVSLTKLVLAENDISEFTIESIHEHLSKPKVDDDETDDETVTTETNDDTDEETSANKEKDLLEAFGPRLFSRSRSPVTSLNPVGNAVTPRADRLPRPRIIESVGEPAYTTATATAATSSGHRAKHEDDSSESELEEVDTFHSTQVMASIPLGKLLDSRPLRVESPPRTAPVGPTPIHSYGNFTGQSGRSLPLPVRRPTEMFPTSNQTQERRDISNMAPPQMPSAVEFSSKNLHDVVRTREIDEEVYKLSMETAM